MNCSTVPTRPTPRHGSRGLQVALEIRRTQHGTGARALQHPGQPRLISVAAAEIHAQGQWYRDDPGILAGKEAGHEVGAGVGHDPDPLAAADPGTGQPCCQRQRPQAQLAIGQGLVEGAARREEVEAGLTLRRVVEALGQGRNLAHAERQRGVDRSE